MADNEQSKIRYDDFIATILPDPAKPESTIMLAGYIGHGADGQVRIYPDPTLGTWYDLPEGDVVHSIPIPDAKLGGSYVWVRASAQITPGTAAAPSAPAPAPDAAVLHPTPTAQPTPATHCFICPPLTQDCTAATVCTQNCTTPLGGCLPHQTAATVCTQNCTTPLGGCLPVQTVATACTQHCTTPLAGCLPVQTAATVCTQNCTTPLGGCLPVQTAATACTQQCTTPLAGCLPVQPTPTVQTHCFVCPPITQQCSAATLCSPFNQCGHHPTAATICTETCNTFLVACLPTLPVNCFPQTLPAICNIAISPNCPPPPPGTPVQQQFGAQAAIQPTPTVQTRCFICPPLTLQQPCVHPTAATICTETCNTLLVGCGHHPTAATICTETCNTVLVGCWQTLLANCIPITQPQICNIAVSPNCPPPPPGTPVQQGQQPFAAVAAIQPTPTVQTHCFVCPPLTVPPACQHTVPPVCPHPTLPTVCTQPPACPHTQPPACPHTQPPACPHTVPPVCPQPTLATVCTQHCPTVFGCFPTPPANCFPQTQPQICNIAISPNCPPPPPGTPVQQQFGAQAAIQPTPTVQTQCFICPPHTQAIGCTQPPACPPQTLATVCTQPPGCLQHTVPPLCPHPTLPTACTQPPACPHTLPPLCPVTVPPGCPHTVPPACPHPTLPTVCTQPPACPHTLPPGCPHTVPPVCPHPTLPPACPQPTLATVCTQLPACQQSVHICPTPSAVHQCGVFTPFGG